MFGMGDSKGPRTRRAGQKAAPKRTAAPQDVTETVIGGIPAQRRPVAASSSSSGGGGSARAGKASRRPRLVDLAMEPLALIHALRSEGIAPDPGQVRSQWGAMRRAFEEKARAAGHREADLEMCVYMLCAYLDAAMLGLPEARGHWLDAGALQSEFDMSGELIAGRRVYERLQELRGNREQTVEALELYAACFRTGYRGRYIDDEPGMEALMTEVERDIAAVRGDGFGSIAPNVARKEEAGGTVVKKFPVWLVPAILGGAIVLSWLTVVLVSFLHARAVAGAIGGY
ncbi:MAG: DotU family type IV/VI secretion system protein [Candidatus Eisenbacteria bacterium]|jgi:type IV/VI secretion system ImpK/VasF family protein|nr:DotU family type IV/VI secretion system protein [Candidatus Eisenbacteria bacterium]